MENVSLLALEWLKLFRTIHDYLDDYLPAGVEANEMYASAMIWFHSISWLEVVMLRAAYETH